MTDKRYNLDKLLIMWNERIDTLEGKRLSNQQFADELLQFIIYAKFAITELNARTKDKT